MNGKLHDASPGSQDQGAEAELRHAAFGYRRIPTRSKTEVRPTKALINQCDLSLAYSPGATYPYTAVEQDPSLAAEYMSRDNLVDVITNGTTVLGLSDIGSLASKPVMKGKGCLFKEFAGVDIFDIELTEYDPDKLVDIIVSLEPTLSGINFEDIKVPGCFYIKQKLRNRLDIPVLHDGQHGMVIISSAVLLNGPKAVSKDIGNVKVAVSGTGTTAIVCLDVMVGLGVKRENVYVVDSRGAIYAGHDAKMEPNKARCAQDMSAHTLAGIVRDVDVSLGRSAAGVLTADMVKTMAPKPTILTLVNPGPEIHPEVTKAACPGCIIATGRPDYPNQVNDVLCFPYILRGAFDCGATKATGEMKLTYVKAITELAGAETNDAVVQAYTDQDPAFDPGYIIPKPSDSHLIEKIAPAVARAAKESSAATRPIKDLGAYRAQLSDFVYHTGLTMRPVFSTAKANPKCVVYAEDEEERVLHAMQTVVDEGLTKPILIGRLYVIEMRIQKAGLRLRPGVYFELANPEDDCRYHQYHATYHGLMGRNGVTPGMVKSALCHSNMLVGTLLVCLGDAGTLLYNTVDRFDARLEHVRDVINLAPNAKVFITMNDLVLEKHTLFITNTFVSKLPNARELADITKLATEEMYRFGQGPKVAMLSYSMFGPSKNASTRRMHTVYDLLKVKAPDLQVEGKTQGDAAPSGDTRHYFLLKSAFSGGTNLLVMSSLDAANTAFNLFRVASGQGVTMGPVLLDATKPVYILNPPATSRRIVNMTVLAVADVPAMY